MFKQKTAYEMRISDWSSDVGSSDLHYVTINVAILLLFLIGVSLIYAVTGTLNMADLAARIPLMATSDLALLEGGAAILGIAFLVKAGMWPLSFWLPTTYAAAAPPEIGRAHV